MKNNIFKKLLAFFRRGINFTPTQERQNPKEDIFGVPGIKGDESIYDVPGIIGDQSSEMLPYHNPDIDLKI